MLTITRHPGYTHEQNVEAFFKSRGTTLEKELASFHARLEKWEQEQAQEQVEALMIYQVKRLRRMGMPVVSADRGLVVLDFTQ
jgi:hypothetical protein